MTITVEAVSALQAGTSTPIVADLPAGLANDDVVVIPAVADATGGSTISSSTWNVAANVLNTAPNPDNVLAALWKKITASETDPSVAASAGASNVFALFCILLRGIDPTTQLDVAVTSSNNSNTSTVEHTPPAVTTVTDDALILSLVAVGQGGGVSLKVGSEAGFTQITTEASYATLTGSDVSFGAAVYEKASFGLVSMPTWRYTPATAASWTSITMAFRPASEETSILKHHNGSAWVEIPFKHHNGSIWTPTSFVVP